MTKTALIDKMKSAGYRWSVDWKLIAAIAWRESSFNPSAIGDNGHSIGLMQVKIATAEWMTQKTVTEQQLLDADFNLDVAARYIAYQMDRYHKNIRHAVAAYNHGSYHESAPGVPVNKDYVDGVMSVYEAICALL